MQDGGAIPNKENKYYWNYFKMNCFYSFHYKWRNISSGYLLEFYKTDFFNK